MKASFVLILFLGLMTTACGGTLKMDFAAKKRTLASEGTPVQGSTATAQCNKFQISPSVFSQKFEHPDSFHVLMTISRIAGTFSQFPQNYIKFTKRNISQNIEQAAPFYVRLSGVALDREIYLQQYIPRLAQGILDSGFIKYIYEKFHAYPQLEFQDMNSIEALRMLYYDTTLGSADETALIPQFESNPTLFKARFPLLLPFHPFKTLPSTGDFASRASELCQLN